MTAAIAVRTLVACIRPSLCEAQDAEGLRGRGRGRGTKRKALVSVARDLDEAVLSFIVQGGTLDPENSKILESRPVLSTTEMKRFGQYVCVSATDDSADGSDPHTNNNSCGDPNSTPHAESRLTPNIGPLGAKVFRAVLGPGSCPPLVPTPIRVYALLAMIRSTALQRPQVRSIPV